MNDPVGLMAALQLFSTYGGQLPPIGKNLPVPVLAEAATAEVAQVSTLETTGENKRLSDTCGGQPISPAETPASPVAHRQDEARDSLLPGNSLLKHLRIYDELEERMPAKTYSCTDQTCGCTDCENCYPNQTEEQE